MPFNVGDPGSIPGSGRSPGEGHGNPLQYSYVENPHGQGSLAGSMGSQRVRHDRVTHTQSSCQCHDGFHPCSAIPTRSYSAFPPACPPGEAAFLSLTFPTDTFSSDLVLLESPGWMTLTFSEELPALLRSFWGPNTPSGSHYWGMWGALFSQPRHLPLAGAPRAGTRVCVPRALLAAGTYYRTAFWRNVHAQEKHSTKRMPTLLRKSWSIIIRTSRVTMETRRWKPLRPAFPSALPPLSVRSLFPPLLNTAF